MNVDELRHSLDELAGSVPAAHRDPLHAIPRHIRRTRVLRSTGIAAALVLIAGTGLWVANGRTGSTEHVNIGPAATSPTTVPTTVPTTTVVTPTTTGGIGTSAPTEQTVAAQLASGSGWVVTDHRIMRTADGGSTWTQSLLPWTPAQVQDQWPVASVLDGTHAWVAVADAPNHRVRLAITGDGAVTVTETDVPVGGSAGEVNLSFVDPLHGFLTTAPLGTTLPTYRGDLYTTGDGGRTWQRVSTDTPALGIRFTSLTDGFANGDGLYATTDGGRSWTQLHPPGWNRPPSPQPGSPSYSFPWVSGRRAVIESYYPTGMMASVTWVETTDLGTTWRDVTPPQAGEVSNTGPKPQLAVISTGQLRVLTGGMTDLPSRLLASDDDGATWTETATNVGLSVTDLSFAGPGSPAGAGQAWANASGDPHPCGYNHGCSPDLAWTSADGGRTWTPLTTPAFPAGG